MIRVGFITLDLALGGVTQWMLGLLRHWDDGQIAPAGVAVATKIDPLVESRVTRYAPVLRGNGAVAQLARASDVLIVWGVSDLDDLPPYPGRVILVSHGFSLWAEMVLRGCLHRATDLAAVSRWAAQSFPEPSKVTVLHNGIELNRCRAVRPRREVRAEWGLDDEQVAIGYVGRLSWAKNPLAAAAAAYVLGRPYRAVYMGEGPHRDTIVAYVRRLCPDAVVLSPVDQIGDILHALDCYVLASPAEGFSLGLLKAWHCGVPTVATQVGGVPELETQYGALTVPVPLRVTPRELAQAVTQALSAANHATVTRACKAIEPQFTAEAMGHRWTEYLMRLMR